MSNEKTGMFADERLREQLRDLERIAERTGEALRQIRRERRRAVQEGLGVGDALSEYYGDVLYKRRAKRDRNKESRLTRTFVNDILVNNYRVVPLIPGRPDAGFKVVSDEGDDRLRIAQRAADQARDKLAEFKTKNAARLAELAAQQQMERFRTAYEGADPVALSEALAELPQPQPRNVMTTADLP